LAWRALVLAPVLGRAGPLLLIRLCPAARTEGAGHALAVGARWPGLVAGGVVAVAVSVTVLGVWSALLLAVTAVLAWGWAVYLRRRIGGFTGDTLGALVEVTEAVTLTISVSLDFLALV
jgi:adenosylcobinamide-GDP ribazoletransferase